jgi:probable aminopeptidase NPEPL1
MPARLAVVPDPGELTGCDSLVFVGRAERLLDDDVLRLVPPPVGEATWRNMVRKTDAGDHGRAATTWTSGTPARLSAGVLPEPCSRHNAPSRAGAIPGILATAAQKGNVGIVLCLDAAEHAAAAVLGVARGLPTFSTGASPVERDARVLLLPPNGAEVALDPIRAAMDAVRQAAHWTDTPPDVFGCDRFVSVAEEVAQETGATLTVVRGDELLKHGLAGLHAVGRAAAQSPALVVLAHEPASAARTVGWVGKGIVFDTGGLAIKAKTSMPGMKTDMAGAAAVLAAFRAAVRTGMRDRLVVALAIAENALGPRALRPDDILTLYSGKTVEVNNPDAEGRLVLADALCWVAKHHTPDVLVDLATLTGAQSIATGKRHAALYCSDEELERNAVTAGRYSGDLVHPLPFAPELFRREFSSPVADMRNSVKDRNNAQPSCAAQFIHNHLTAVGYDGPWLHVDMAAPAVHSNGRGTGFGVGLLLALAGVV